MAGRRKSNETAAEKIARLKEEQKAQILNVKNQLSKKMNALIGKAGKENELSDAIATANKKLAELNDTYAKKIATAKKAKAKDYKPLYIAIGKSFLKLTETKESVTKADVIATLSDAMKKKYGLSD